MTRVVPFGELYSKVAKLSKFSNILLYSSTAIAIGLTFGASVLWQSAVNILIGLNGILIAVIIFIDYRANYLFTKAEMGRRLDWLDNSFETNFSGSKSKDYFTNEHLSPGLYKLSVNCFENSFHSSFIIDKMLPWAILKNVVIIGVFVMSAFLGEKTFVKLFFELVLPVTLLQELVKTVFYSSRICKVVEGFKGLFNDLMKTGFDSKTAEALKNIIEYETTLAWASLPLSSRVFNKHRHKLAKRWEQIKKNYQIQS